jgi:hypothetical protein
VKETMQQVTGSEHDTISAHVVAAMLGLHAAERAAASRPGWDSVEEWSLAWGGVVTAQRALSGAAGPHLEVQAAQRVIGALVPVESAAQTSDGLQNRADPGDDQFVYPDL